MFEDSTTLTMTLTLLISITLGLIGLVAFMWGLRTGQFDDEQRFTHGALFDGEDELNAARDREAKQKAARKPKENPPA
ncbi:MAG: cbb3-type cytochrome oxidase assembly protein CcoS [Campylobacterales bacterium]